MTSSLIHHNYVIYIIFLILNIVTREFSKKVLDSLKNISNINTKFYDSCTDVFFPFQHLLVCNTLRLRNSMNQKGL